MSNSATSIPNVAGKPLVKRSQGACAECRRKRSRCDRALRNGQKCTNCENADIDCVIAGSQKSQLQQQQEYIRILEKRVKRLENYIQALFPNDDVDVVISKPPTSLPSLSTSKDNVTDGLIVSNSKQGDNSDISDEDDMGYVEIANQLRQFSLTPIISPRFIGQGSPIMAAKQAATMRSLVTGQPDTGLDPKHYMRSQFWSMNPWEHAYITSSESTYVYPEPDLLLDLVTVYFEKTNTLIPIVHEPSFMKGLLSGKHHVDPSFGQIVLLVCANGARYSTDPRACYAPESQHSNMSNGWQFFRQVPVHRRQMFYTTTVYDLQYYALAAIFVNGSALCSVSSNIVGIGLRYAIEIGAHRRNGQIQPSFENEHSKRA